MFEEDFYDIIAVVPVLEEPSQDIGQACHAINDASFLWLAGDIDSESYLDRFAEFGDVDSHVDAMVSFWERLGLL